MPSFRTTSAASSSGACPSQWKKPSTAANCPKVPGKTREIHLPTRESAVNKLTRCPLLNEEGESASQIHEKAVFLNSTSHKAYCRLGTLEQAYLRSANICLSGLFSSSRCFSRVSSATVAPAYLLFQA
jgi:hypothetical protein